MAMPNLCLIPGFITWSWDMTGSVSLDATNDLTNPYDGDRATCSTCYASQDNGTATVSAKLIATFPGPVTLERIYAKGYCQTEEYGSKSAETTLAVNDVVIDTVTGFNYAANVTWYYYDNSTVRNGVTSVYFKIYVTGNHPPYNVYSGANHYELELYGDPGSGYGAMVC